MHSSLSHSRYGANCYAMGVHSCGSAVNALRVSVYLVSGRGGQAVLEHKLVFLTQISARGAGNNPPSVVIALKQGSPQTGIRNIQA